MHTIGFLNLPSPIFEALFFSCTGDYGAVTHIPLILGGAGVFLAMLWVVATGSFDGVQSIALGLFTGIVQGVLVAGCSVYANQLVKQAGRAD